MRSIPSALQTLIARLRGNQDGSAALEFAIIAPVLIMLTVGLIDIGRFMWYQNTVEHVAREGSRYAAVHSADSAYPVGEAGIEAFVQDRAVGIADQDLAIAVHTGADRSITILVTYQFNLLIGNILPFHTMQITGRSVMTS